MWPPKFGFLHIAGGSHFIQWEMQRKALHAATLEWFSTGRLCGSLRGEFSVNAKGRFQQDKTS